MAVRRPLPASLSAIINWGSESTGANGWQRYPPGIRTSVGIETTRHKTGAKGENRGSWSNWGIGVSAFPGEIGIQIDFGRILEGIKK